MFHVLFSLFHSCIHEEKPQVVNVEGRKDRLHNWIKSTTTKNEVVNGKNIVCDSKIVSVVSK